MQMQANSEGSRDGMDSSVFAPLIARDDELNGKQFFSLRLSLSSLVIPLGCRSLREAILSEGESAKEGKKAASVHHFVTRE